MNTNKYPSVSALVPAYNEEKGLKRVLDILTSCTFLDEVICISDGSSDNTSKVIKGFKRVKAINLPKNHGKAYAIVQGIRATTSDIVLFIDADITGLNNFWLKELLHPLVKEDFRASIGYFNKVRMDKYFKPLGGQRAYFREDLLPYLSSVQRKRFGLELYLNFLYKDKKVKLLPLHGIGNTLKHKKYSPGEATKMFLIESFDIVSEILRQRSPVEYFKYSYLNHFYIKKDSPGNSRFKSFRKYYFLGSLVLGMAVLVFPSLAKANPPIYQNLKNKARSVATAVEMKIKESSLTLPATFSVKLRKGNN